MTPSPVPVLALIPPRESMLPKRKRDGLCPSCDRPILVTGECAGCTGS